MRKIIGVSPSVKVFITQESEAIETFICALKITGNRVDIDYQGPREKAPTQTVIVYETRFVADEALKGSEGETHGD